MAFQYFNSFQIAPDSRQMVCILITFLQHGEVFLFSLVVKKKSNAPKEFGGTPSGMAEGGPLARCPPLFGPVDRTHYCDPTAVCASANGRAPPAVGGCKVIRNSAVFRNGHRMPCVYIILLECHCRSAQQIFRGSFFKRVLSTFQRVVVANELGCSCPNLAKWKSW